MKEYVGANFPVQRKVPRYFNAQPIIKNIKLLFKTHKVVYISAAFHNLMKSFENKTESQGYTYTAIKLSGLVGVICAWDKWYFFSLFCWIYAKFNSISPCIET